MSGAPFIGEAKPSGGCHPRVRTGTISVTEAATTFSAGLKVIPPEVEVLPSKFHSSCSRFYKRVPLAEGTQLTRPPALMRPSISGRLEDIVLELAAVLLVGARVVPLAAARVAGAALPSEAARPAWAALYAAAAGP